jgi:hypothetical protein
MAAMSTADREAAARALALALFSDDIADFNHTDLTAAVGSLDDALEASINDYLTTDNPAVGTDSLAVAINKQLPEPFKSQATNLQKSLAFSYTVLQKYGS